MENLELKDTVEIAPEEEIDKKQLLEWLDALVDNLEQQRKLRDFNSQIKTTCAANYNCIQIYKGIEKIAKVLNVTLKERTLQGREMNEKFYQYSLVYRNMEFLQLSKEKW